MRFFITGIFDTVGVELIVMSWSSLELDREVLGRGILLVGVGILTDPPLLMSLLVSYSHFCICWTSSALSQHAWTGTSEISQNCSLQCLNLLIDTSTFEVKC